MAPIDRTLTFKQWEEALCRALINPSTGSKLSHYSDNSAMVSSRVKNLLNAIKESTTRAIPEEIAKRPELDLAKIDVSGSLQTIFSNSLLKRYDALKGMIRHEHFLQVTEASNKRGETRYTSNCKQHLKLFYRELLSFYEETASHDYLAKSKQRIQELTIYIEETLPQYLQRYEDILKHIDIIEIYQLRNEHIKKLRKTFCQSFDVVESSSVGQMVDTIEKSAIAHNNVLIDEMMKTIKCKNTAKLKTVLEKKRRDIERMLAEGKKTKQEMSFLYECLSSAHFLYELQASAKNEVQIINAFKQIKQVCLSNDEVNIKASYPLTNFHLQGSEQDGASALKKATAYAIFELKQEHLARAQYKNNFTLISSIIVGVAFLTALAVTGIIAAFTFPTAWIAVLPLTIATVGSGIIAAGIAVVASMFLFKNNIRLFDQAINEKEGNLIKQKELSCNKRDPTSSNHQSTSSLEKCSKTVNGSYWYTDQDMKNIIDAACLDVGYGRADRNKANYLLRGDAKYQGTLPELPYNSQRKVSIEDVKAKNFLFTGLYDSVSPKGRYVVAVTLPAHEVIVSDDLPYNLKTSAAARYLDARTVATKEDISEFLVYELLFSKTGASLKDSIGRLKEPLIKFLDTTLRNKFINVMEAVIDKENNIKVLDKKIAATQKNNKNKRKMVAKRNELLCEKNNTLQEKRSSLLKVCMYYKLLKDRFKDVIDHDNFDGEVEHLMDLFIQIEISYKKNGTSREDAITYIENEKYRTYCTELYKTNKRNQNNGLLIAELKEYAGSFISEIVSNDGLNVTAKPREIIIQLADFSKEYEEIINASCVKEEAATTVTKETDALSLLVNEFSKKSQQDLHASLIQARMAVLSDDILCDLMSVLKRKRLTYQDAIAEVLPAVLSIKDPSNNREKGNLYRNGKILMPVAKGKNTGGHWKYLEIRLHYLKDDEATKDCIYITVNYSDPQGDSNSRTSTGFKKHIRKIVVDRCMEELLYHRLRQIELDGKSFFTEERILMLKLFYDEIFNHDKDNFAADKWDNGIALIRLLLLEKEEKHEHLVMHLREIFPADYTQLKEKLTGSSEEKEPTLRELCEFIISNKLSELFKIAYISLKRDSEIFREIVAYLLDEVPIPIYFKAFSNYDRRAPTIQMKKDWSACGVCTAEAIKARIAGEPLPDEQEYHAITLRKKHIKTVFGYLQKEYKNEPKKARAEFLNFLNQESGGIQKMYDISAAEKIIGHKYLLGNNTGTKAASHQSGFFQSSVKKSAPRAIEQYQLLTMSSRTSNDSRVGR